jgi:hypothetical protein
MTGNPGDDLDWRAGHQARAERTGQKNWVPAVTSTRHLAGPGRTPGSRVIAFATWLLALLGGGLMYVSFDAQYQFILAQKDARVASLIEAAMLDAGMVILSALGIGLARAGKPSGSARGLIMICAGASAGMNFAAADPASWRPVVAYVSAPVFLAVITDRVIAVIRQHVLPPDTESAWAPLGAPPWPYCGWRPSRPCTCCGPRSRRSARSRACARWCSTPPRSPGRQGRAGRAVSRSPAPAMITRSRSTGLGGRPRTRAPSRPRAGMGIRAPVNP